VETRGQVTRQPSEEEWKFLMGGDENGNCRGCGKSIGIIDPDCSVCMIALTAFMDDEPDFPALLEAAHAI